MSDGKSKLMRILIPIGILLLVNGLSFVFGWGFIVW